MRPFLSRLAAVLSLGASALSQSAPLPHYDHVVVVIMSIHSPDTVIGSASAPYINGTLLPAGAQFAEAQALYAPEQPNYIVLLAGGNLDVVDDACLATPFTTTDTLPRELVTAALTFTEFSEGLPAAGDTSCASGLYTRAHNAVTDFSDLPAGMNQPYAAFTDALSSDTLPTVSYVIPNICHDMHGETFGVTCNSVFSDTVATGDAWLSANVPLLLSSPAGKSTLLIVAWDLGDATPFSYSPQIPVIFIGPHVKKGYTSPTSINHFAVLRLIEDLYAMPELRGAAAAVEITDVFDDVIFQDGFD
jgi:phospholipase C